jgi:hypothetical protein
MFPFVASQAIALKQAKRTPAKAAPGSGDASPRVRTARKGFFRRVLDALVDSRRRKADLEIEAQERLHGIAQVSKSDR